jgi:hypothetical protein
MPTINPIHHRFEAEEDEEDNEGDVGFAVGIGVGTGVASGVGLGVASGVGFGVGVGIGVGGVGTGVGIGVGGLADKRKITKRSEEIKTPILCFLHTRRASATCYIWWTFHIIIAHIAVKTKIKCYDGIF